MADVPPQVIDKETDARFWASMGYKPGQKLDPSNPTDAKMIPVWLDIQAKVQHEAATGTLVTTFDHPTVTQNIAAAHAADQETAAQLAAAAHAPDPATAHHHVVAAAQAADASAQKTHAAAAVQPPTGSPQLAHQAAQHAAQEPPPPGAPLSEHVAHAQALAAHTHMHKHLAPTAAVPATHGATPRSILDKETDARFWAATGYKPGQKLDPSNPSDAHMIPMWLDTYAKVQREDAAGQLVLTYNNPVVAQHLADAHVADQAAAMHLDHAAGGHPHEAPHHIAAAATAAQVSAHKTASAAKLQPPTISPKLAHDAARAQHAHHHLVPPLGSEQLAHEQAKQAGARADRIHQHHRRQRGHGRHVRSTLPPQRLHEYRAQAAALAQGAGSQFVLVIQHPDGSMDRRGFHTRAELDAAYAQLEHHHDQYKYAGAFDLAANPSAPVNDSVGVPAAEHVETPPPSAAAEAAPSPDAGPAEGAPPSDAPPADAAATDTPPSDAASTDAPSSKWSGGTIAAIAVGAVVAGGIVYTVARKRKAPRGTGASPKVFVTTPSTSTRALRP